MMRLTDRDIVNGLEETKIMLTQAVDRGGEMAVLEAFRCMIRVTDAITMLKAQEPKLLENQHKPYGISTNANSPWISRCPRCGKKVEGKQTRFCKYCGQAVKWDG